MCTHRSINWSSQTAKSLPLHHTYFPLVAPCGGVTAGNWVTNGAGYAENLAYMICQFTLLMPAPNDQREATVRPLSTSEAGSWTRDLLKADNADKSQWFLSHPHESDVPQLRS